MTLLTLKAAQLAFGDAPILLHADVSVQPKERICLVGRNGAGKSTLLKVLNQEIPLDDGQILLQPDLVIARLEQDPPRDTQGTVYDFVADGVAHLAQHLKAYHHLSQQVALDASEKNLAEMARLQAILDHHNLWQLDQHIQDVVQKCGLTADTMLAALSGGWLRKAAFARALVSKPQLLLLDEPTNHLDIATIAWLEAFLQAYTGSIMFISHDRAFIRRMATRIIDLDRGRLTVWPGDYTAYLTGKEASLRVETQQHAEFDRKLAQEEVWIRQGIKARRTRNEGRVRALKKLRQTRAERHAASGKVRIQTNEAMRSGKMVLEMEQVSYASHGTPLIHNFSAQVMRGDKIALVGANGCGKTTLLRIMLDQLPVDSGRVRSGTNLTVAYFDQHRAQLDAERTVLDNLAGGRQEVVINGKPRHALGYLQDFLFPPKRALTPVKALSGGERNRLLLARLFLLPSNLLVLDEPTNDLDVETLELLEEHIAQYQGTLLLVSHDREFVDNTVTECWFFEGDGQISCYAGGYTDAAAQRSNRTALRGRTPNDTPPSSSVKPQRVTATAKPKVQRLTYQEARELAQLPDQLVALESTIATLQATVSSADFFNQPPAVTSVTLQELAQAEQALESAFERWAYLEALNHG